MSNHTPTVQGNSQSGVAASTSISLTSLFSYSDLDGISDIVSFDLRLQTSNGGHLYHNGVLWPDGQLTPDQSISTLSQWSYVAGPAGTSDTIGFNVTDHAGAFNPTVTAVVATQAALLPSISSVSPSSIPGDANDHAVKILGSNFQSGDTLTFADPQGNIYQSVTSKLNFVAAGEIDYSLNDGSDPGTWTVKVNSPDGSVHSGSASFIVTAPVLTPSISSVSPNSIPADANDHAVKILGSNFQSGDTLTFTDPQGNIYQSVTSKLNFVAAGEIDYNLNDGSDPGTWIVKVNSPDSSVHSSSASFIVTPPVVNNPAYDATIVPGGTISQHFAAQSAWGSIALNTSDIPAGHANDPLTHPAVDILAPLGSEVDAFAAGTVVAVSTGASDSYWTSLGWYVLVYDPGSTAPDVAGGQNFYTLYLHLNNQPQVQVNQTISAGSKIGVVGTTGNETGVPAGDGLLHFEIRLFADLFQPYSQWNLPKISGSKSNIYVYGADSAAQLLADPANTGLGYVNPENFLNEGSSSDARPAATGHNQIAAAGTVIPLTTLFTYSDADGPTDIVGFSVQDHTNGGGYLTLGGVKQSDNTVYGDSTYGLPISQIGQWAYVVGPTDSVDSVAFNAIDSHGEYNSAAYATITTQGGSGGTTSGIDYRVQTGNALTGVNVAALHSDSYQFVGEYIGNATNSGYLTQSDAQTLGSPIVSIYERSPDHIGYFTIAQADADANSSASAITAAENVAHQPLGTAIYFTVDPAAEASVYSGFGALSSAYITAIETYFQRVSSDFAAQGNPYKIGIYGPGDVLTAIKSLNLPDVAYYWVDTHWGTSFPGANIQRVDNGVSASPTSIGVNVDTDTALTSDIGQWTASQSGVAFIASSQSGAEGSVLTFRISIQNPNYTGTSDYRIYYNTTDGSATAGSDYTGINNQVAVDFTASSAQFIDVTVQTLADANPNEGSETFNFNIYDYQHTLLDTVGGTITNVVPTAPEITVLGNGTNIADGDTTPSTTDLTDFGSVTQGGAAVQHIFTVRNDGTAALTISGLTLPSGFSLVEGLSASIAPGNSDTFTVQLSTAGTGAKGGQISFATNDNDENPFKFPDPRHSECAAGQSPARGHRRRQELAEECQHRRQHAVLGQRCRQQQHHRLPFVGFDHQRAERAFRGWRRGARHQPEHRRQRRPARADHLPDRQRGRRSVGAGLRRHRLERLEGVPCHPGGQSRTGGERLRPERAGKCQHWRQHAVLGQRRRQ